MRERLTYANVMATVAVFIALGGASYAAIRVPKNSVGTKQIRKDAVNGTKVKDNTLTGKDVDERSLGTVPHADSAMQASQALDAQMLAGLTPVQIVNGAKLNCPSGMTLVIGVCFEQAARPETTLIAAQRECAQIGRRLPTQGELIAFQAVTFTDFHAEELADGISDSGPELKGMAFAAYRYLGDVYVALNSVRAGVDTRAYRCVTMPTN